MRKREGKENITWFAQNCSSEKGVSLEPPPPPAPESQGPLGQLSSGFYMRNRKQPGTRLDPAQAAYHVVVGWEVESVLIPQQPAVGVVPVRLLSIGPVVVVVKDLLQKREAISHSPFFFPPCCGLKVKCPPTVGSCV